MGRFATVDDLTGFAVPRLSSASDDLIGPIVCGDGGWLAAKLLVADVDHAQVQRERRD